MFVYLWPTGWCIICLILCCFINVLNYVYSNCGAILGGGRGGGEESNGCEAHNPRGRKMNSSLTL